MRRLIELFGGKVESTPIRQDAVFVSLSAMACAMELPEAPDLFVEAFRRQLEGWTQYEAAIQTWRKKPDPHSRPTAPHMANPLQGAAFRSGPSIVPGFFYRFSAFLMAHLFPRRMAIRIMGRATRKLYG